MGRRLKLGSVFLSSLLILSVALPAFAEVKFKGGPYLRVRHEYWRNWLDLADTQVSTTATGTATNNDNRNFFRIKSSLWGQADFDKNISIYAKVTNENRAHLLFEGTSANFPDKYAIKKGYHYNPNEVFVDNLYLDIKGVADRPLDLRIGRQDLIGQYGDNFLICDGTPGDGSRSFYFNAMKAAYKLDDKNTVDLIYIDTKRDEEYLPVINRDKLISRSVATDDKLYGSGQLATTDEQGYVLYWKNKNFKNLNWENYYIYKRESEEGGTGVYSTEKTKLSTIGSYAKYVLNSWTLRGQFAGQFGDYGSTQDRTGIGGYGWVDKDFKSVTFSPRLSAGYMYLSGDQRGNSKQEGFDPLFSRGVMVGPFYSEMYGMTMAGETGIVGYITNMQWYRTELVLKPTKSTKVTLTYNLLRAAENVDYSVNNRYAGKSNKTRGHFPSAKVDYTFNKYTSAYVYGEYFIPGGFYRNDDPGVFLRTELQLKF